MSALGTTGPLAVLGFDLLHAERAPWLLLAPAVLAVGLWGLAARRRARARLVAERHRARFLPGFSANRATARVLLAATALVLAGFALLGPVRGYTLREVHRAGLDIVVCFDTSRSMLVEDVRPNRLERAKREVIGLLDELEGDRIALVAFSGDVRDVAPLTHDRETMRLFVESLSPDDNLMGGTNLGAALEHALELFDGRTGAHEAVVLLTDGEDLEGQGLAVAERAAEQGIRVFVVGMGTPDGGKIPEGSRGFVRNERGEEVISHLDDESLRAIADATGGAYLAAARSAFPLEELYAERISRLESRDLWFGKERVPHDRYQWPLVLAFLCMVLEAGLRERRGRRARVEAELAAEPSARTEVAA